MRLALKVKVDVGFVARLERKNDRHINQTLLKYNPAANPRWIRRDQGTDEKVIIRTT